MDRRTAWIGLGVFGLVLLWAVCAPTREGPTGGEAHGGAASAVESAGEGAGGAKFVGEVGPTRPASEVGVGRTAVGAPALEGGSDAGGAAGADGAEGFAVELVDSAGRPAPGLRIGWLHLRDLHSPVRTDEQGRGRLAASAEGGPGRQLVVELAAPEWLVLDWSAGVEIGDVRRFEVPDHGWIEWVLSDPEGLPVEAWAAVDSGWVGHEADLFGDSVYGRAAGAPPRIRLAAAAGRADLVWAAGRRGSFPVRRARLEPLAAGEQRRIDVSLDFGGPWVTGRVVDGAGEARAELSLFADVLLSAEPEAAGGERSMGHASEALRRSENFRTGADGRFALELLPAWRGRQAALVLRASEPQGLRVDLGELGEGRRDLGDLVLVDHPTLAGGWIENRRGEPVAGASVVLEFFDPHFELMYEQRQERTLSDEEGRFAIPGLPLTAAARLSVEAAAYETWSEEVVVPTVGRTVQLEEALVVTGRVLVDGELWVRSVRLRPSGADLHRFSAWQPLAARGERRAQADPGSGVFRFVRVAPGSYDVLVGVGLGGGGLVEAHGVEPVRALDANPDGLVLDLRGKLQPFVLRVRARSGPAPERISVMAEGLSTDPDGGPSWSTAEMAHMGEVRLFPPESPVRLLLIAEGMRAVERLIEPGEHEVVLDPAPRFRLVFDPPLPELPGGLRWIPALVFAARPGAPDRLELSPIGDGSFSLHPPLATRYVLSFNLRASVGGGGSSSARHLGEPVSLWIDPDAPDRELRVTPPPALREWAEELEREDAQTPR